MNFSDLFEQAQLVDPTDSIKVDVSVWRHYSTQYVHIPKLEWSISSIKLRENYQASDAETVLERYRVAYREANEVRNLAVDLAAVDV